MIETTFRGWRAIRYPFLLLLSGTLVLGLTHLYGEGESSEIRRTSFATEEVVEHQGFLSDGRIDLANASRELLLTLPEIGPERADSLLAARTEQPFLSLEDASRRADIPLTTLESIELLAGLQ